MNKLQPTHFVFLLIVGAIVLTPVLIYRYAKLPKWARVGVGTAVVLSILRTAGLFQPTHLFPFFAIAVIILALGVTATRLAH